MSLILFVLVMIASSVTHSNAASHNYLDDNAMCHGSTVHIMSHPKTYYLSAWDPSSKLHSPISGGCTVTFSSYGLYGAKYKFEEEGYINSENVTVNIYSGSSTNGTKIGTYGYISHLPTHYIYTQEGYITVELVNPTDAKDFSFTIKLRKYDDVSDDDDSDYFLPLIIGVSIAGALLVIPMVGMVVYMRMKRKRFLTNVEIGTAATVTNVKTSGYHEKDHHSGHY